MQESVFKIIILSLKMENRNKSQNQENRNKSQNDMMHDFMKINEN